MTAYLKFFKSRHSSDFFFPSSPFSDGNKIVYFKWIPVNFLLLKFLQHKFSQKKLKKKREKPTYQIYFYSLLQKPSNESHIKYTILQYLSKTKFIPKNPRTLVRILKKKKIQKIPDSVLRPCFKTGITKRKTRRKTNSILKKKKKRENKQFHLNF